ncbi:MAG: hypothetical protein HEP71_20915 [Roseivirga sp.]|nr:hypothetical protein [Roseivirga sp.]
MDRQVRKRRGTWKKLIALRNSLPGLIIESLLITFGVLLAFAVDNWKSEVRLHRDTEVVLKNLKSELLSNRSVVLEWLSYHDSLYVRLDGVVTGSLRPENFDYIDKSVLNELYPEPSISYLLQKTAWQTAHSAQVIKNFQYRTTYNLTHCYEHQSKVDNTMDLLFRKTNDLSLTEDNYQMGFRTIRNLFSELSDQEHYMLGVYRDALIEIDKELVGFER